MYNNYYCDNDLTAKLMLALTSYIYIHNYRIVILYTAIHLPVAWMVGKTPFSSGEFLHPHKQVVQSDLRMCRNSEPHPPFCFCTHGLFLMLNIA